MNFRTPVTLINGPIKRALDESHEPEVKKQLQIAERNSNYLLSLVNELMDFRKLDADKVVLNKTSRKLYPPYTKYINAFQYLPMNGT